MKAVALILVLAFVASCQAATYEVEWAIPPSKTSLTVKCGDTITLTWPGQHDLYKDATGDCSDFSKALMLAGPTQEMTFNYKVANNDDTFYFVCTLPGHCQSGQKLKVTSTCSSSSTPKPPAAKSSNSTKPPSPKLSSFSSKPPAPKSTNSTKPPSPKSSSSTKPPSPKTSTKSPSPSKTTTPTPPSPSKTTSPVVSSPTAGNTSATAPTPPPTTKPSGAVGGAGLGSAVAAAAAAVLCFVALM